MKSVMRRWFRKGACLSSAIPECLVRATAVWRARTPDITVPEVARTVVWITFREGSAMIGVVCSRIDASELWNKWLF